MSHTRFIISMIVLCLALMPIQAQLLVNARQFGIMYGQPRSLTLSAEGQPDAHVQFDEQGRVIQFEQGEQAMSMVWADAGKSSYRVTCTMTAPNGETMSNSFTVSELTSTRCRYTVGGMDYDCHFKVNGAIRRVKVNSPNGMVEMMPKYRSIDDAFPYQIYQSDGSQSATLSYQVNATDNIGNATSITQSANGQTITTTRTIEYY